MEILMEQNWTAITNGLQLGNFIITLHFMKAQSLGHLNYPWVVNQSESHLKRVRSKNKQEFSIFLFNF